MVASVEASLRRLKTDRIDIYWAHWPDHVTPSEEIVRGFEDLARAGKILYAGLSNFTAWRLARAVTLAELTRAVPIAAAQFEHSLVQRAPEADLFPARSDEHTSELQSLMRNSYAVFRLKKKKNTLINQQHFASYIHRPIISTHVISTQ